MIFRTLIINKLICIFSTYLAFPDEVEKDIFAMPKRNEIEKIAIELLKRLDVTIKLIDYFGQSVFQ